MRGASIPARPEGASWRYILTASFHNVWIIVLPMLIVLSHRNIVGAMVLMVVLGTLWQPGLIGAITSLGSKARLAAPGPQSILAVLVGFALYAFVSVAWTPLKSEWEWALNILLFFLVAAGFLWTMASLPLRFVSFLSWFLLGGIGLSILLQGIEGGTGGGVRDLVPPPGRSDKDIIAAARGVTISICILPAFLFLAWRKLQEARLFVTPSVSSLSVSSLSGPRTAVIAGLGVLCVFCLGIGAATFSVSANLAALMALIAVGVVAWIRPQLAVTLIFALWAAAFLLAPFLAGALPPIETISAIGSGPASWLQRLAIWRFAADHIFASPASFLFGGGVNYSQALNDMERMIVLPGYPQGVPLLPTHTHNVFVQVWLEFGLVGAALLLTALWLAWRFVRSLMTSPLIDDNARPLAMVICAMAAAFFVFCAVDASLWTPWRLAAPVFGLYTLIAAYRLGAAYRSGDAYRPGQSRPA